MFDALGIDGLDCDDIVLVFNCLVNKVKSRLFWARTRLKKQWETQYRSQWEGPFKNEPSKGELI